MTLSPAAQTYDHIKAVGLLYGTYLQGDADYTVLFPRSWRP